MSFEVKSPDGKVVATVNAANPNGSGCDEGVWVEMQADDGTRPTLCMVKDKPDGPFKGAWYFGVYRDTKDTNIACDFAILFDKEKGPQLQVVRGQEVQAASLFDLLKAHADECCRKKGTSA